MDGIYNNNNIFAHQLRSAENVYSNRSNGSNGKSIHPMRLKLDLDKVFKFMCHDVTPFNSKQFYFFQPSNFWIRIAYEMEWTVFFFLILFGLCRGAVMNKFANGWKYWIKWYGIRMYEWDVKRKERKKRRKMGKNWTNPHPFNVSKNIFVYCGPVYLSPNA